MEGPAEVVSNGEEEDSEYVESDDSILAEKPNAAAKKLANEVSAFQLSLYLYLLLNLAACFEQEGQE